MKKQLLLPALFILVAGCDFEFLPDYNLPVYEQEEIKGTAMLSDGFRETNAVPAKEAVVFLSKNSTANPSLYKIIADKDGIFTFPFVPDGNDSLYLVGRFTDSSGLAYEGNLGFVGKFKETAVDQILTLNPIYPGGILKVVVQGIEPGKQPVNGADVYLFTNDEQAASINTAEPGGFVQKKTTNEKGIAFFNNLKPGNYIIIGKISQRFTDQKVENISATLTQVQKLAQSPTILSLQPRTGNGRIRVIVRNKQTDEPLAKVHVYLFTSRVQAETIYNDTGPNSYIDMISTSAGGEAIFQNLNPGNYYAAISADFSETQKKRQVGDPATVQGNQTEPAQLTILIP